jgi:hypothetical protein
LVVLVWLAVQLMAPRSRDYVYQMPWVYFFYLFNMQIFIFLLRIGHSKVWNWVWTFPPGGLELLPR